MNNSRRAHQCRYCDSEGVWQLFVRFVTTTPNGILHPFAGKSSVKVCTDHREAACEAFMSDDGLDRFARVLKSENLGIPHPNGIQFEFADLREHSVN